MKAEQVNEINRFEAELSDEIGNEGFALLAHDVRSSVFGLLGSLESIDGEGLSPEMQDRLKRARTSGALLNDLLKLVFGGADAQKTPGSLVVPDEIELLVQRWYDQAESAGIHIDTNVSRSVETLDVIDRTGFHRIFNNLIGNAIKFSQGGSISINSISRDENVVISITDSGPGFSESALGMLFEFRGRPENSPQEGSGLGLYISEMLVTEVGGTIAVENKDSGGACVTVTFPSAAVAIRPPAPHIDALPDLSHLNILLAEDNVTNQLVVTQMLKSMGAKFQVASDGVETLAIFEREDFDVVLLDIEMPRKSGLEVLREIRARNDAKSGIPMIALTAYVMQEHREKISAAGADGVIAKPIAGIAPLGHQILEYIHGTPAKPQREGDVHQEASVDNPGYVDCTIYDVITKTIGPDFQEEFLEKVMTDFGSIKMGLITAEAEENYTDWRSHSHILISVAGAIGATNLQRLAQDLNKAANAADKQTAQPLNLHCIKGISRVVSFLINKKAG
jgi:CheY-like chemotaxis protein